MQDPMEQCRPNETAHPEEKPLSEEKPVAAEAKPPRPRNLEEAIQRGMMGCLC